MNRFPILRACQKVLLICFILISANHGNAQVNFLSTGNINIYKNTGLISVDLEGNTARLHDFFVSDPTNVDKLILGPDGKIYGTTSMGGRYNSGTLCSIDPDGTNFSVIYSAGISDVIGKCAFGPDNKLYVIISQQLFRMELDGTGVTQLASLPGTFDKLLIDSAGWVYGRKQESYYAVFYKIKIDGSGYQVIHSMNANTEGIFAQNAELCLTPSGRLYGVCNSGGVNGDGGVFSFRVDGTDFIVHASFDNTLGYTPSNGAPAYANGKIFFTVVLNQPNAFGKILALDTVSSSLNSIYSFANPITPLSTQPIAAGTLLLGFNQSGLYSINQDGTNFLQRNLKPSTNRQIRSIQYNAVTNDIFYIGLLGKFANGYLLKTNLLTTGITNIHDFGDAPGGYYPDALTKDADGKIYGITVAGGAHGTGILFKTSADGTGFQKIFDFASYPNRRPFGQLLCAGDNKLYGVCNIIDTTTTAFVKDIIFSIEKDGSNYTEIKVFDYATDGRLVSELTLGTAGNILGMATNPYPRIFKINMDGSGYTILKDFYLAGITASDPSGGLVYYNGYYYGVTKYGGDGFYGILFRIKEDGTGYSTVYSFYNNNNQGYSVMSGITLASNNKLYGATGYGGINGSGIVFSLNPDNLEFQNLYNFNSSNTLDGYYFSGKFIQASDGRIYCSKIDRLFGIDTNGTSPARIIPNQFFFSYNTNYNTYLVEIAASDNLCEGNAVHYTSNISGAGYTYQWQVDTGSGFVNLLNDSVYQHVTDSVLYTTSIISLQDGYRFRCAVNNGITIIYSDTFTLNVQNTWTGAADDNWNNIANWYCGKVPGNNTNVTVPAAVSKYPTIHNQVICRKLVVQNGAQFNIAPGGSLVLTGE